MLHWLSVHQTCASEKLFIFVAQGRRHPDPCFPRCHQSSFPCLRLAFLGCFEADANAVLALSPGSCFREHSLWGRLCRDRPCLGPGTSPGQRKGAGVGVWEWPGGTPWGAASPQQTPAPGWTLRLGLYLCIYLTCLGRGEAPGVASILRGEVGHECHPLSC